MVPLRVTVGSIGVFGSTYPSSRSGSSVEIFPPLGGPFDSTSSIVASPLSGDKLGLGDSLAVVAAGVGPNVSVLVGPLAAADTAMDAVPAARIIDTAAATVFVIFVIATRLSHGGDKVK
jgi:hypothetical protein